VGEPEETFSVTIGSGPVWNRPWPSVYVGPPPVNGLGTFTDLNGYEGGLCDYQAVDYTPTRTGTYSIEITGSEITDPMLFVYTPSFDPDKPFDHFLVGDDDSGATLKCSLISSDYLTMTAGTTYTIVVSSCYQDGFVYTMDFETPPFVIDNDGIVDFKITGVHVSHILTYAADAGGSISGSAPQTVDYGLDGTSVTAAADTGYHFAGWSDGVLTAERTDTGITDDLSVTAHFAANSYALTYSAGANGTLSGSSSQIAAYGLDGTAVTAIADAGYHFTGWSDGVQTAERTDTVMGDLNATANFAVNSYTVTFQDWDGSVISSQQVEYGKDAAAPANPVRSGYAFAMWNQPFTNVTGNIITSAVYSQNPTPTPALGVTKTGEADNQTLNAGYILLAACGAVSLVLIFRRKEKRI